MTASRRVRLRWEALAWLLLAGFVGSRLWPQVAAAFGVAAANAVAPQFALTTLDGRTITSTQLRGKVVLVNFWVTWCSPCRVEMPGFQSAYQRRQADGFVVLGISTDASGSENVRAFLSERHITYPVAMASAAVVRDFGGASVLPTSFLIDREGRIRNEIRGAFTSFALERAVDHLLAEAPEAANARHSEPGTRR